MTWDGLVSSTKLVCDPNFEVFVSFCPEFAFVFELAFVFSFWSFGSGGSSGKLPAGNPFTEEKFETGFS